MPFIARCLKTIKRSNRHANLGNPGLGAEKNDRVWTCVALCPNCHRETHISPDADRLNAVLLEYARQWAPPSASKPDKHLAGVTN